MAWRRPSVRARLGPLIRGSPIWSKSPARIALIDEMCQQPLELRPPLDADAVPFVLARAHLLGRVEHPAARPRVAHHHAPSGLTTARAVPAVRGWHAMEL